MSEWFDNNVLPLAQRKVSLVRIVLILAVSVFVSVGVFAGGEFVASQFRDGGTTESIQTQSQLTDAALWVRTTKGWERSDHWFQPDYHRVSLHPLYFGALQLLVSVGALATFSDANTFSRTSEARNQSPRFPRLYVEQPTA